MAIAKMPGVDGREYWIWMHSLSIRDNHFRFLRPIHILTLLSQHLVTKNRTYIFSDSLALENKLYGIRYFSEQLRGAISQIGDPIYSGANIRDYEDQQRLLCVVEAYFGSLYTSLELAARINWRLKPGQKGIKANFRETAKHFSPFSFKGRDWLKQLFDIRSELQHYGSAIPQISPSGASIIMTFSEQTRLEYYKKRQYEISFDNILGYAPLTFKLLDDWSLIEFKSIPKDIEVDILVETGPNTPLKKEKIMAAEFLKYFL